MEKREHSRTIAGKVTWCSYCGKHYGGGGLVAKSCPTLATQWTVALQAPPSMGFSRQEYWSGLPFPSPGDLPNPGIEPRSPELQADYFPTELLKIEVPYDPEISLLHIHMSKN